MKYIDISLPISEELVTYPGNPVFSLERIKEIDRDDAELSKLIIGTHTGTHVDAPRHFIKGGKGVDKIESAVLNGVCRVIDCTYVEYVIKEADIKDLGIQKGERLLFKTKNSDYVTDQDFVPGFVSLGLDAAQYLANREVALIGTDYLSIEAKGSPGHPVHKAILKHGIPIIEGLNLQEIEAGKYELICLPLRLVDADGSPCRAMLKSVETE